MYTVQVILSHILHNTYHYITTHTIYISLLYLVNTYIKNVLCTIQLYIEIYQLYWII